MYETNCGASIENITVAMDEFKPYLEQVSNATNDSIESLYCSQFTPIYTDIMHDGKLIAFAYFSSVFIIKSILFYHSKFHKTYY